jgi:hypothetical protein
MLNYIERKMTPVMIFLPMQKKLRCEVRLTYLSHPMTEPFYRCVLTNNPWQGWQYVNGTFDEYEKEWKFGIEEIRELLDESGEL